MTAIIIPCFNEAERLNSTQFLDFIEDNQGVQFFFVNDGSTDNTKQLIDDLQNQAPGQISSLHCSKNKGKAEAVRQGILQAVNTSVHYVGYWDADLATPLSAIPRFLNCFKDQRKMICGARVQRMGADIDRHWYRHYPGRIIATIVSTILGLPFYDTQCGAKIIERTLAEQIFSKPFISPWLFDVELIARIINKYGPEQARSMIFELPLENWTDIGDSKISMAYIPKIPIELLKIYTHYRSGKTKKTS